MWPYWPTGRDIVPLEFRHGTVAQDYINTKIPLPISAPVLFEDEAMASEIMASYSPREQKALGRQVKNFDDDRWKASCREIVKRGNLAKVGV